MRRSVRRDTWPVTSSRAIQPARLAGMSMMDAAVSTSGGLVPTQASVAEPQKGHRWLAAAGTLRVTGADATVPCQAHT
jgi:hypothetical protein